MTERQTQKAMSEAVLEPLDPDRLSASAFVQQRAKIK